MLISLVLSSLVAGGPGTGPAVTPASDPAVRLWMSSNRTFSRGDAARVQVETGRAGHLIVLHFSPEGRLSVLFPILPGDDDRVESGRRYEIRDEHDASAFTTAAGGHGLVYAAISDDPWRFDQTSAGGWDYAALTISEDTEDPEADITRLVQRMGSDRGFDYDVLDYTVEGETSRAYRTTRPGWWTPRYVDDYYECWGCGWGPSGIYVGFGWPAGYAGWPWWYYRGYGYRYNYGYGYGGYYGYPYYPYYGGVVVNRPRAVVVGRPRGYTIEHLNPRPRTSGTFGEPGRRTGSIGSPSDSRVPARRARPETGRARGGEARGGRGGDDGGAVTRPSNDRGGSRPSGDRGQASRPRSGGDRARPRGGREDIQVQAPAIEQSRPESRDRGWVRVEEPTIERGRGEARRVEGSRPVLIDRSRSVDERARAASRDRVESPRRVDTPDRPQRIESDARRARPAESRPSAERRTPEASRMPSSAGRRGDGGAPRIAPAASRSSGSGDAGRSSHSGRARGRGN